MRREGILRDDRRIRLLTLRRSRIILVIERSPTHDVRSTGRIIHTLTLTPEPRGVAQDSSAPSALGIHNCNMCAGLTEALAELVTDC